MNSWNKKEKHTQKEKELWNTQLEGDWNAPQKEKKINKIMIKQYKHKVLNSTINAVLYNESDECVTNIIEMLKTSIGISKTDYALYIQNPKWNTMKISKGDFICKNIRNDTPFIVPGNKMRTMYKEI